MNHLLIQNARHIVSAAARPVRGPAMGKVVVQENSSVYIRDGVIQAVGSLSSIEKEIHGQPQIVDAGNLIVLPGFIDSHTHLVFAGTREDEFRMRIAGADYQEIAQKGGGILSTVEKTRSASRDELIAGGLHYLATALQHGTTTMEIKSGYGLDAENEIKLLDVIAELNAGQPIELIPTFLGAHAVPPGKTMRHYADEVRALLPAISDKAKFCDVFCEQGYFGLAETRAIFKTAKRCGLKLRLHADQLSAHGGVALAVEMGATSVDHLEKISKDEIALLAQSDTCATLLPGVSLFLNYGYPPGRRLVDQGCIVVIASNFNPGSCMCLNMQLVISLACTQMALTPEEALNAATVNAAHSLDLSHVGLIQVGQQADVLLLDLPNYRMLPYYFGTNHVHSVIKRGCLVWSKARRLENFIAAAPKNQESS